jgi:Cu+-exporting ATPase
LSTINTIVFDKTGTLTQNDDFDISWENLSLDEGARNLVIALARQSTHPVSTAIYKSRAGLINYEVQQFEEIVSKGTMGIVDGRAVRLGSASFVGGDSTKITGDEGNYVFVSIDNVPKGYILLKNKYRHGFKHVIAELEKNYDLHVLSGDNETERERLTEVFGTSGKIHFRQTPHQKLEYVRLLRKQGAKVLMVGDGLNDAGALQESDLGISIADDVYHFSPACDGILDSGQFGKLGKFIRFGKTNVKIVKISIMISLVYNISGTTIAAMGLLTPIIAAILMPLSSVSVVLFVTLATSYLAKQKGIS